MAGTALTQRIAAVRRFNRFYTQRIGVLREGWGKSLFSLAEARVLYELARRDKPTASEIAAELGLDAGYLSRLLRGFKARGMITKERSRRDGRQRLLARTARGRNGVPPLEAHSNREVGRMLPPVPASEQERLVAAIQANEG